MPVPAGGVPWFGTGASRLGGAAPTACCCMLLLVRLHVRASSVARRAIATRSGVVRQTLRAEAWCDRSYLVRCQDRNAAGSEIYSAAAIRLSKPAPSLSSRRSVCTRYTRPCKLTLGSTELKGFAVTRTHTSPAPLAPTRTSRCRSEMWAVGGPRGRVLEQHSQVSGALAGVCLACLECLALPARIQALAIGSPTDAILSC